MTQKQPVEQNIHSELSKLQHFQSRVSSVSSKDTRLDHRWIRAQPITGLRFEVES